MSHVATKILPMSLSYTSFNRTWLLYDNLHQLAMEEESIWPEKYRVDGFPRIRDFPPKRNIVIERDEL